MKLGLARFASFYNRAPALYRLIFTLYKIISDRKERALFSSWLKPGDVVNAINLDIQGAELATHRGAERVLQDNSRLLVVLEYWPFGISRAGERPAHVIEFLQARGFRVSTLDGGETDAEQH